MKLKINALVLMSLCLIGGCASTSRLMESSFDSELAKHIHDEGTNSIQGQAFLRQRGGNVVTCAASEVRLIPATKYAKEYVRRKYGTDQGGYDDWDPILLENDPKTDTSFWTHTRTTTCDAEGEFEFDGVPDGTYYVTTRVMWSAGQYSQQGGDIAEIVDLAGNDSKKILLTH